MKYMIMLNGSQRDYDLLTGAGTDQSPWTPEDVAALHAFMGTFTEELIASGEFVDGQGLEAPVHTRRVRSKDGAPVVTDGPYAETQEVLAGYYIVECASFDQATELAARLASAPYLRNQELANDWFVDIRPIGEAPPEPEV